jgi:hypothetical protein
MGPAITAFILTFLANIAAGVVIFLIMLIAMNGYSESDAMYGFGVFIICAVLITFMMSLIAAMLVVRLQKREFRAFSSVFIATAIFSVTGIVLKVICSVVGVVVAEFVRVNF